MQCWCIRQRGQRDDWCQGRIADDCEQLAATRHVGCQCALPTKAGPLLASLAHRPGALLGVLLARQVAHPIWSELWHLQI
jgi:hypothetical protein